MEIRVPNQIGHLQLRNDGAIQFSSGDLENDERSADIIMSILQLVRNLEQLDHRNQNIDPESDIEGTLTKVSLVYDDHCYVICLCNRKVYVVKKPFAPPIHVQDQPQAANEGDAHTVHV